MQNYQFNSYALGKTSSATDDYPHQDHNRFVFVTNNEVPNTVWIYRYHNNKELNYPCVLEDKSLNLHIEIDCGMPVTINTARTAWKLLLKHGFTREMEYMNA